MFRRAIALLMIISSPSALPYSCRRGNNPQHSILRSKHQPLSPPSTATSSSTRLGLIKNWWEDDLPNILGINPLEAAVIFGALYYVYGPTTLYDYAKEAGKFVSTYAPIVKDVSFDIFNEFRDYLEEDKEREALKKSGIDIKNLPRRTTNIIERFQQSYAVICVYLDWVSILFVTDKYLRHLLSFPREKVEK